MSDDRPGLLSTLTDLQKQYRQRSLENRLEDVATDLRDIKLQIAIMDELFDASPSIEPDLTESVRIARAAVDDDDYDRLAEMIDDLEQTADETRASVEQSLNQQLVSHHKQVSAMQRLNERLDAYPQAQLAALEVLFNDWNWKAATSIEDFESFDEQIAECRDFGRDMRSTYREAQRAVIEPLIEEGLEEELDQILASEPVYLGQLSGEKREALAKSELGEYLTISLG
jgi:hypothetical protein